MAVGRRRIEEIWRSGTGSIVLRALLTLASGPYAVGRAAHRALYALGIRRRTRLPVPVVSIGNLVAGGVGKTPFAAWLARELLARGLRVMVLGRGYRRARGARLNDEGLWLERVVPQASIVQDPRRHSAAQRALAATPCDVVLLDDGFQHEPLARDLDVVLVDSRTPLGNGRLLPRGPLREPPAALQRADWIFATRAEQLADGALEPVRALVHELAPHAQFGVVRFEIAAVRRGAEQLPAAWLCGRAVALLTAVGDPAAVRATVERLGGRVVVELAHPDHHLYTAAELGAAARDAERLGAELVVTEKDAMKLDALAIRNAPVWAVLVQQVTVVEGGAALVEAVVALRNSSAS